MKNVKKIGLLLGIIISNCYADQYVVTIANEGPIAASCTSKSGTVNIDPGENHIFNESDYVATNFSCKINNSLVSTSNTFIVRTQQPMPGWNETVLNCGSSNHAYLYTKGSPNQATRFTVEDQYTCNYSNGELQIDSLTLNFDHE